MHLGSQLQVHHLFGCPAVIQSERKTRIPRPIDPHVTPLPDFAPVPSSRAGLEISGAWRKTPRHLQTTKSLRRTWKKLEVVEVSMLLASEHESNAISCDAAGAATCPWQLNQSQVVTATRQRSIVKFMQMLSLNFDTEWDFDLVNSVESAKMDTASVLPLGIGGNRSRDLKRLGFTKIKTDVRMMYTRACATWPRRAQRFRPSVVCLWAHKGDAVSRTLQNCTAGSSRTFLSLALWGKRPLEKVWNSSNTELWNSLSKLALESDEARDRTRRTHSSRPRWASRASRKLALSPTQNPSARKKGRQGIHQLELEHEFRESISSETPSRKHLLNVATGIHRGVMERGTARSQLLNIHHDVLTNMTWKPWRSNLRNCFPQSIETN